MPIGWQDILAWGAVVAAVVYLGRAAYWRVRRGPAVGGRCHGCVFKPATGLEGCTSPTPATIQTAPGRIPLPILGNHPQAPAPSREAGV